MAGTVLYLLLLALLFICLIAVVLLPAIAVGCYFLKWKLPRVGRAALVEPGEPLLCGLENPNG
jgi:hypothetical protein